MRTAQLRGHWVGEVAFVRLDDLLLLVEQSAVANRNNPDAERAFTHLAGRLADFGRRNAEARAGSQDRETPE